MELLRNAGGHPAADWIYDRLKKEFPSLSMGTVYRNLKVLAEQGLIRRIDFGSAFGRYDAVLTPHHHFVCESCGSIQDLELPVDESLNDRVRRATPFVVHRHRIEFYGVCDRCAKKMKE